MGFLKKFYSLDLFQRPIHLFFKGQDRFSSRLGVLLSLFIYGVISYTLYFSDIFYRRYPRIFNDETSLSIRPQLVLRDSLFAISLVDDSGNLFSDPSLFSILAKNLYFETEQGKGLILKYMDVKELDYCENMNYHQETIKNIGLSRFLCLKNNTMAFEGFFDEPVLKMFSLEIKGCDNSTQLITCKSQDEINSFLKGKKIQFVYPDNTFDMQNYPNPIKGKFHTDFQLMNSKVRKIVNIYFKKVSIMTDDGILFSNSRREDAFVLDSREQDFDFTDDSDDGTAQTDVGHSKSYLMINIFSAGKMQQTERYYQNLSELFSTLGGLLNSLILVGFILSYIEKSLYLTKKIMNRLYTFQPEKRKTREIGLSSDQEEKKTDKSIEKTVIHNIPGNPYIIQGNPFILPSVEDFKSENMIFMGRSSPEMMELSKKEFEHDRSLRKGCKTIEENEKMEDNEVEGAERHKEMTESQGSRILHKIEVEERRENEQKLESPEDKSKEGSAKISEKEPESLEKKDSRDKSWFNFSNIRRKFKEFTTKIQKTEDLKSRAVQNLEKFQDFQDSKNKISINLLSYVKLQFSRVFCCKKTFNENLFLKAQSIFTKELDIVNILRKLQELEKLKMVLLTEKQLLLFNVLAKPMVYLDRGRISKSRGEYTMAEVMSSTLKNKHLKETVEFYEKKENSREFTEVDKRLLRLLDNNVKDFMQYFQE